MNILIVEDNPLAARLEMAFMQKVSSNAHVDIAPDCYTAELKTRETIYDIILMDFGLPDGHGLLLTKKLRSEGVTAMIIAVSGNLGIVNLHDRIEAGLDGGYHKPFTVKEASDIMTLYKARLLRQSTDS